MNCWMPNPALDFPDTMSDPKLEPDLFVAENAPRLVGRTALKKLSALVLARQEEENTKKRLISWILVGLGFLVALPSIVYFAFEGHPKVRLFAMSVAAGIVLSVIMVIWSHSRSRRKRNFSVEEDAKVPLKELTP